MQHWNISETILIQVPAMVKCVPQHMYAGVLVQHLEAEIQATVGAAVGGGYRGKGAGRGKGFGKGPSGGL